MLGLAVWVFTDLCSGSYMEDDLTDVDRHCHVRDDETVRLGFKPKLGVLQKHSSV